VSAAGAGTPPPEAREPLAPPAGRWLVDDGPAAGPDWRALLAALRPRWRALLAWTLAGGVLLAALSLVLPPVYVASTMLMEARGGGADSPLAQLGLDEALPLHLGTRAGGVNTYPDIVRSRALLTTVLERSYPLRRGGPQRLLDRLARRGPDDQRLERAVKRLRQRVDPALDRRTGILTLRVRMDDPVLAAAVATAVTAALQDVVVRAMNAQAGANRAFVEQRLAGARGDLARSEDALRAFRESNLRGSSPRVMTEESRLLRETKVREEIVLTLSRERELAGVEEHKDVPVISVLDPAVPPATRSAPRRGLMAALGLALGLVAGAGRVLWTAPRHERVAA
jgi:uncharacterized protein involved in exopolysaccharide biosynthesis